MLYPLKFHPIFKPYIWGGRNLERLFGKPIPPTGPVAESWEIVDRAEENSVVANGPLAGRTLRWLMENHGAELLGRARAHDGRFPLLMKILDAQEKLSLQVHPPASVAGKLGGEPKTEMWYIHDAGPGACLYVGLKRGVTRQAFEAALQDGTVAACFHRIEIRPGDVMFLPSGRVHGIGGNCVLIEIQQNSDTTYRVYDWGRLGPDGKPRPLHIEQALQCIDFEDCEPALEKPVGARLVQCEEFLVERHRIERHREDQCDGASFHILCVLHGTVRVVESSGTQVLSSGEFLLLPAGTGSYRITCEAPAIVLKVCTEN